MRCADKEQGERDVRGEGKRYNGSPGLRMKLRWAGRLCGFCWIVGFLAGTEAGFTRAAPWPGATAIQEATPGRPDSPPPTGPASATPAGDRSGSRESPAEEESPAPQAGAAEPQDQDPMEDVAEAARRARENPLLRKYFLRIFTAKDPFGLPSVMSPDDPFTQDFVDRQIDAFVFDLHERLEKLASLSALANRLLERWEHSPGPSVPGVVAAFIGTLEQIRKESDGVADRLSLVLVGMERKFQDSNAIRRELDQSDAATIEVVRRETDLIRDDLAEGNRLVRDYFFAKSNVVSLEDLAGANMLQRFDAAEARAKALAEFLKARED
ncbi:MAG: hypothetical protein Kow00109_28090 [Acidobacteriota bacterium]